jgi:hypothetical protein
MIASPIQAEHIGVTGRSILTLSTLLKGLERFALLKNGGRACKPDSVRRASP